LNRPHRLNALTIDTLLELERVLVGAENDPAIGALTLFGNGPSFCAGWDLKQDRPSLSAAELRQESLVGNRVLMKLWSSPLITLAGVHGYCIGAGCELALACDLTFVTEDAQLWFHEIELSMVPIFNMLSWVVGQKTAKTILLGGLRLTAAEAKDLQMISAVLDRTQLEEVVLEKATKIAGTPRPVLASFKAILNKRYEVEGFRDYVDYTTEAFTLSELLRDSARM
jgi:enoyl-CoA hydratase